MGKGVIGRPALGDVSMVPFVGVVAAAVVAGAGAVLGWRLVRSHLLPNLRAQRSRGGDREDRHAKVIEADYVDVTDARNRDAD